MLFYRILEDSWAGREMEKNDLICLTYFYSLVTLCGSSSLCSSWECLCWSCELNPDPANLGSSSWVWAEWSHLGLQGMLLQFHTHFSVLPGHDFVFVIYYSSAGYSYCSKVSWRRQRKHAGFERGDWWMQSHFTRGDKEESPSHHSSCNNLFPSVPHLRFSCRSFTKQRIWTQNPRARQWGGTTHSQCCCQAWGSLSCMSCRCWRSPASGTGCPAPLQWQKEPRMMVSLKLTKRTISFWANLLMQISSSGASVGDKYLDFGGNFFSALNPRDCIWYSSAISHWSWAENLAKAQKTSVSYFLLPCS